MRLEATILLLVGISGCLSAPVVPVGGVPVQRLETLKRQLVGLQTELRSLNSQITSYVKEDEVMHARENDKREFRLGPQVADVSDDVMLHEFQKQLSESERAMLSKMNHKVRYLQRALRHPKERENNPGDDAKASPVAMKRTFPNVQPAREDREYQDFVGKLDANDKALLKRMKSKTKYLQSAVHTPEGRDLQLGDVPVEDVAELHKDKAKGSLNEQIKEKRVQPQEAHLAAEDRELLLTVRSKLDSLRDELEDFRDKRAFKPLPKRGFKPLPKRCVGENCQEARCLEGRCQDDPEKSSEESVSTQDSKQERTEAVAKRFMDDVKQAKANGVDLRSLMNVLSEYKARVHAKKRSIQN